jgi:hypothetical protein
MNENRDRNRALSAADYERLRNPAQGGAGQLDAEGQRLFESLPTNLRLTEITTKYPRILNQLAKVWIDPDKTKRYFEEMFLDARGQRSGFSDAVIIELMALRDHYLRIVTDRPVRKSGAWDDAPGVDRGR